MIIGPDDYCEDNDECDAYIDEIEAFLHRELSTLDTRYVHWGFAHAHDPLDVAIQLRKGIPFDEGWPDMQTHAHLESECQVIIDGLNPPVWGAS